MGEIHRVVSVSLRHGFAFVRGNLDRPYGFGRTGTVFGVAPSHNVEALVRRRSPKAGTVALRNLVPLYLAGTTRMVTTGFGKLILVSIGPSIRSRRGASTCLRAACDGLPRVGRAAGS